MAARRLALNVGQGPNTAPGELMSANLRFDQIRLSPGYQALLTRGCEWAATGQVTQNVPASFPTANTVSYRADLAAMDPGYRLGLDALSGQRR